MRLLRDPACGELRLKTKYAWGSDLSWTHDDNEDASPEARRLAFYKDIADSCLVFNIWEEDIPTAALIAEAIRSAGVPVDERMLAIGGSQDRLLLVTESRILLVTNARPYASQDDHEGGPPHLDFGVSWEFRADPGSVEPIVRAISGHYVGRLPFEDVADAWVRNKTRASHAVVDCLACEVVLRDTASGTEEFLLKALFGLHEPLPVLDARSMESMLSKDDNYNSGQWDATSEDLLTVFSSMHEWHEERKEQDEEELRLQAELRSEQSLLAETEAAARVKEEQALAAAAAERAALVARGFTPRLIRNFRDAECAARDWLRCAGHPNAELTPDGADGGYDVFSDAVVAQVKAEMVPTGRPVIQQIAGIAAVEGKSAMCFSLAGFTREATVWAARAGVQLYRSTCKVSPKAWPPGVARLMS